jgi:hypothetical protein
MALANGTVARCDLENPAVIDTIDLAGADTEGARLFIDPWAHHLLVSTQGGTVFHVPLQSTKARIVTKLKSCILSLFSPFACVFRALRLIGIADAVAWNSSGTKPFPGSTGLILLGTSQGALVEAEIDVSETTFREKGFKMVCLMFGV